MREQRLRTIEAVGALALERKVDAVLVAGDVFDMNTVAEETLRRFAHTLEQFRVPWVLLPGNHDPALAESAWTRLARLALPSHVHLLTSFEPLLLANGRLAILPAPLRAKHEPTDLTEEFANIETPSAAIRVGLAHGAVTNRLPARAEASNPISDTRASQAQLDYLALGDWHGTLKIAERTWYSGTPETDRFRDNDSGNVLLVDIEGPGAPPVVETIRVGHYRWTSWTHSVHNAEDIAALHVRFETLDRPWDRHLVSLKLQGAIDLTARAALEEALEHWQARLRFLQTDEASLHAAVTEEEIEEMGGEGFVRQAVARLRSIQLDNEHPDRHAARDALAMLYSDYQEIKSDVDPAH